MEVGFIRKAVGSSSRIPQSPWDNLTVYDWPEGSDLDGYYFTWALLPYDEMAA
jgi:hypothetical protein